MVCFELFCFSFDKVSRPCVPIIHLLECWLGKACVLYVCFWCDVFQKDSCISFLGPISHINWINFTLLGLLQIHIDFMFSKKNGH
jgi:hypothetical protein